MRISGQGPKLTAAQIDAASKRLPRPIPPPFRSFLVSHNGGHPTPSGFTIPGRTGSMKWADVRSFLGIGVPEETEELGYVLKTFEGRIPDGFFPVARDAGGNLILVGTSGDREGAVFFSDQEEQEEDGQRVVVTDARELASSLDEFVKGLSDG